MTTFVNKSNSRIANKTIFTHIVNVLKVIDEYSEYNYVNKVDTTKFSNHILKTSTEID